MNLSAHGRRYEVRGEKVIHHVEISLFPNWSGPSGSGKAQERSFAFSHVILSEAKDLSGDRLTLTAPPMRIGGVELTLVAIWQRPLPDA